MIACTVKTRTESELVDMTGQVQNAIRENGFTDGIAVIFCPHTTAGLTLNENWDVDVRHDLLLTLDTISPHDPRHRHGEGNSPAHLKASLVGASTLVIVEGGRLQLGRWQGIYLAEFDGPRTRTVWIKLMNDGRKAE